uniref:Uncharacterized protein n=1 Tax=Burkholderia sp. (strain TH2) TaxID=109791 RepID=Q8GAZ9_BURST|nr:hypothetical protein [Burkholderia sp. TH2]
MFVSSSCHDAISTPAGRVTRDTPNASRAPALSTHSTSDCVKIHADWFSSTGRPGTMATRLSPHRNEKIHCARLAPRAAATPITIHAIFANARAAMPRSPAEGSNSAGVSISDQPHTPRISRRGISASRVLPRGNDSGNTPSGRCASAPSMAFRNGRSTPAFTFETSASIHARHCETGSGNCRSLNARAVVNPC